MEIFEECIVRLIKRIFAGIKHRVVGVPVTGTEKGADYYDDLYRSTESYNCPYYRSFYYFLWSIIADRVSRQNPTSFRSGVRSWSTG